MPVHWRDNLDKYIEALAYNPEAHAYDNVRYTSSAQFKRLETNGTTVTLRYPKKMQSAAITGYYRVMAA